LDGTLGPNAFSNKDEVDILSVDGSGNQTPLFYRRLVATERAARLLAEPVLHSRSDPSGDLAAVAS